MAFLSFCHVCKKSTVHTHGDCLVCKEKPYIEQKELFLEQRSKLHPAERMLLIESEIYDLKMKPKL